MSVYGYVEDDWSYTYASEGSGTGQPRSQSENGLNTVVCDVTNRGIDLSHHMPD